MHLAEGILPPLHAVLWSAAAVPFLAWGLWSVRRRVTLDPDAAIVPSASDHADPCSVRIDGEPVEAPHGLLVVLHKPAGVVCSHDEAREGPSVYGLLPARWVRRNPPLTTVGRLDKPTTGLLILTDLGALVHRWTSPRHKIVKRYEATLDRAADPAWVERFASGSLMLEGESKPCLPARLELPGGREAVVELTEGRYHQVRRMFAACGATVIALHRSRFGPFALDGLDPGQWRTIDPREFDRPTGPG